MPTTNKISRSDSSSRTHSAANLSLSAKLEHLRGLNGREKYKFILANDNSAKLVQAMPPQDLFLLVKELGRADVSELLAMANGAQVTLFVDMDCWHGDNMDADEAQAWIQQLQGLDEREQLRIIDAMDFDLLVLMLKKQFRVIRGMEALDDDELEEPRLRRDQLYECEYRDPEQAKCIEALQELLFRERQGFYLHLMETVRHETDMAFEEEVYQARNGRLADFGFIETFEARKLRAWLDPQAFDPADFSKEQAVFDAAEEGAPLPGFVLTVARPRDILADVMANSMNNALCQELTYLLNRAMSADLVDVGNAEHVSESLEDVYNYLNIALGYLAGTDVNQATQQFETVYLQTLYRLGFSLTVALQRRAQAILATSFGAYLDGPDAALVKALNQSKPRFYAGVENTARADERPFRNYADVKAVSSELDTIETLLPLFGAGGVFNIPAPDELDLDGCIPPQISEVTLSELFLTAIANKILGKEPTPEPIPVQELETLHQALHAEVNFTDLRRQSHEWLEQLAPGSGAFAEFCFDMLEHEFYALRPEDLKPEYVGGLLIRL